MAEGVGARQYEIVLGPIFLGKRTKVLLHSSLSYNTPFPFHFLSQFLRAPVILLILPLFPSDTISPWHISTGEF